MPEITIEVQGLQGLLKDLDPKRVDRAMKVGMDAAMKRVRHDLNYPKKTEANQPKAFSSKGNNRWYQRGFGPKWARKDGTVGGTMTSEVLGKSWTHKVKHMGGVWYGRWGTKVSYAPFVHGEEQAGFHKARGWKSFDDIIQKRAREIGDLFAAALRREFRL